MVFVTKKNQRKQGHDTIKFVHLRLPKAIPLYVHYTGNTMVNKGLWYMEKLFFKDKLTQIFWVDCTDEVYLISDHRKNLLNV